jgi:hypothetical protein
MKYHYKAIIIFSISIIIACLFSFPFTLADNIVTNNIIENTISNTTSSNTTSNLPKEALFDIIAEIVSEPQIIGEDLLVKISLVDFGVRGTVNANLTYIITDNNKVIVRQYTKTMPVTVQTEFLDHVNTTGLLLGQYSLDIDLKYLGQTDPAHSEKIFYIGKKAGTIQSIFKNTGVRVFVLSTITMVLFIGVYRRSQRDKSKEKINHESEELNK